MFVAIKNHDIQPINMSFGFQPIPPAKHVLTMFLGRGDTKEGLIYFFWGFYVHKKPLGIELKKNGDIMGIPCGYVTSNSSGLLEKKTQGYPKTNRNDDI